MIRRFTKAFIAVAISLIATVQAGKTQELWKGLQVGMTVEEVSSLDPLAAEPNIPDRLANGAQELLSHPQYNFAGHDVTIRYFFKSGLVQVTLKLADMPEETGTAVEIYDNILEHMVQELGQPLNQDFSTTSRAMQTYETEWKTPHGVKVKLFAITGITPLLNIVYQSPSW